MSSRRCENLSRLPWWRAKTGRQPSANIKNQDDQLLFSMMGELPELGRLAASGRSCRCAL